MIKRTVVAILLSLCFIITASADYATTFTVNNASSEGNTLSVNVVTDTVSGVGGIDLTLNYDTSMLKVKKSSVKCSLSKCELVVNEGSIRVLWDTTEEIELSEVLLSADFQKIGTGDATGAMNLSLNDYYDNTLELNDIPYTVSYFSTDEVQKVKSNPLAAIFTVLGLIISLVAVLTVAYYLYINRKIEQTAKHLADTKELC